VPEGVLAPIFVDERPWGMLLVASPRLTRDDAAAVALFATHVGSTIEVAESLQRLQRAHLDLVERERLAALGELAAVIAHEVRNPLAVLFNALGALRGILAAGAPRDKLEHAKSFVAMAAEESDRLNRMVSDLLDFARPSAPRMRPSSIVELLDEVAAAVGDPRISIEVVPDLPLIDADARTLRQAVLNVVLNAIQAIGARGRLTIRAQLAAVDDVERACIEVIDDGPGIPPHVREHIFEPFYTTKACGTGLGLAIVKRIIDAHRGDIAIESSTSGTTFTLRLPVRQDRRPAACGGAAADDGAVAEERTGERRVGEPF
jgi:two-component system sensor histidine kinase HydH